VQINQGDQDDPFFSFQVNAGDIELTCTGKYKVRRILPLNPASGPVPIALLPAA
jgi:hypothetical protein